MLLKPDDIEQDCYGKSPRMIAEGAILLAIGACFFVGLSRTDIADKHEAWVVVAGRNMAETGEWIVPQFNGRLRLQKPPLPAWTCGVMEKLFGPADEALFRLPAAILGVLGLFCVLRTGRILFDSRTGLLAAIILATMIEYFYHARMATPDIYLFFWVSLGFWLLSEIFFGSHRRDWLWPLLWLAIAGAWLSKYLVPFAFLMPAMLYGLWKYKERRPRGYWHIIGIALFFGILLGWGLWLIARIGWPAAVDIWKHDFTTNVVSKKFYRFDFYKYILWFFAISFPWSILAGAGIFELIKRGSATQPKTKEFRWLGVIFAAVFILFSFGSHKKITYIMPLFPLIAILIARAWLTMTKIQSPDQPLKPADRWLRRAGQAQAILLIAAGLAVGVYGFFDPMKRLSLCLLIGASFSAGGLIGLAGQKRRQFRVAIMAMGLGAGLANFLMFNRFIPRENARVSIANFARQVKDTIQNAPIAFYGAKSEAMIYYLHREIPIFSQDADLRLFVGQYPDAFVITSPAKLESAQAFAQTIVLRHQFNINTSFSLGESDDSKEFLLLRH